MRMIREEEEEEEEEIIEGEKEGIFFSRKERKNERKNYEKL